MQSDAWDLKFSTDDYVYTKEVNRFVKEHLSALAPGKVIDLAGGEGRNTVFFAEAGWQAENIDFSQVALDKCQKLAQERGVEVFTTLGEATSFESQLRDVDLALIAYLQAPKAVLRKAIERLVERLRSGGVFFGVWHAIENLSQGYGGPQNPEFLPSVETLREILSSLPLDIEVLENRDGQVQTTMGLRPSVTLTALARKH